MSASRENIAPLSLEKFIELFKPTFSPGNTVTEAVYEAKEVVFLRLISQLDQEILGLESSHLTKKYKALLQLITHKYFTKKQVWALQELAYTKEHVNEIALSLAKSIYESLHSIRAELNGIPNEGARQDRLKEEINISGKPQNKELLHYFKMRNNAYIGIRVFNEVRLNACLDSIVAQLTTDDNLEVVKARVVGNLMDYIDLHELNEREKLLFKISTNELEEVIDSSSAVLSSEDERFQSIHKAYLAFLRDYQAYLEEISTQIEAVFPKFYRNLLNQSLNRAFEKIRGLPKHLFYLDNFKIELYLQQIRKPHLFEKIFSECIFVADLDLLTQVLKETPPHSQPPVPSMHQMLNDSYIQLATDLSPEPTAPNNFMYIRSDSVEVIEDVKPILESKDMETSSTLYKLLPLPQDNPPPFFEGSSPGTVTTMDILLLNSFYRELSHYQLHYRKLSKLPMNAPQHADRATAAQKYGEDYREAKTVEKKAALLAVAKPYINRHKHFDLDKLLGINITNTWNKILKFSREDALEKLKHDIRSLDDESSIATLQAWRNMSIFSQHRSNFKIFGAFGRTSAQKEIDEMILSRRRNNR